MHEDFRRPEKIKRSSERSFGRVMAGAFLLIGLLPLLHEPYRARWWAVGVAVVFAAGAQWAPALLAPLNVLWLRFGLLLHKIISPVVLGLLFYSTVLPVGLLMRAFGKDPMRLRPDPAADSYWVSREPPGPSADSMTRQF
jgi:hypothetical protein